MTEQAKKRKKELDHARYVRQREKRLQSSHDRYWENVEKSREYYRNWHRKRTIQEMRN